MKRIYWYSAILIAAFGLGLFLGYAWGYADAIDWFAHRVIAFLRIENIDIGLNGDQLAQAINQYGHIISDLYI